jgi:uncharacterized protein (TIGR02453 family)
LKTPFAGFPEEGVAFLRALKKHNRREWFQPRKELFAEQVLRPMVALVEAIQRGLLALAPDYAHGDPRKAVYRIYRDTRFSADKTPYKTHIAASLTRAGLDKGSSPGIYFSVGPDEVEVGGGWYLPLPPQVLAVRNAIAAEPDRFRRIVEARELTRRFGGLQGARLTRPPKGFAPDHPAADYLKFKQFFVYTTLDASLAVTPRLYAELMAHIRTMLPLVDFLSEAAGGGRP